MKRLIFLALLFCGKYSYSQVWNIVADEITERIVQRIVSKSVTNDLPYVFSTTEKNILLSSMNTHYKNYSDDFLAKVNSADNKFVWCNGTLFRTNYSNVGVKEYFNIESKISEYEFYRKGIEKYPANVKKLFIKWRENYERIVKGQDMEEKKYKSETTESKSQKNIQYLPANLDEWKVRYLSNPKTDVHKVYRIQAILICLGYDIKLDGKYGRQTQTAIEGAFGIDCTSLAFKQVYDLVFIMFHQNSHPADRSYQLKITEKLTEKPIEETIVNEKELNDRLEKLSCKPSQLCLGTGKNIVGLKFTCKNEQGVEIEISLSDKVSLDIGLKAPDGSSTEISMDTEGKINFSTTNNGYTRAVSNKP